MSWRGCGFLYAPWLYTLCALSIGGACLLGLAVARTTPLPRRWVVWIVAVGLAMQVVAIGLPRSDDVARYVIEGQQILAGQNPYRIPPGSPQAAALADPTVVRALNHPHMTAIYPPVALAVHTAVQAVHPGPASFTVAATAAAMLLIGLCLLLLRAHNLPLGLVVAVAWNPVLAIFASGEAHNDIFAAVLVVGALLFAARSSPVAALVSASLAALVKPFALVALPALLAGRSWRWWLLPPAIALLAYAPFVAAGSGLFASLGTFGGSMHFHGAIDPWLRLALRPLLPETLLEPVIRLLLVLILAAGWAAIWKRRAGVPLPRLVCRFACVLLLCLPTLHAWYFIVLVPLLPFTASWGMPLWTAMAGIYWLHGIAIAAAGGVWCESLWVVALAHAPAMVVVTGEALRSWRAGPDAQEPHHA
jgi:hypothetical protein